MQDFELNEIWKQYDRRLEEARILNLQSWALNLQNFESLQTQKAKSKLNSLAGYKIVLVMLGIVWVAFLAYLIFYSITWSKIFFVISAAAIAIITSIAIIVYLKQVWLIKQINQSDSVLEVQEKAARLQSTTMQSGRILFLQAPFYCTWFLTPAMIREETFNVMLITVPVTLLFAIASIWLYKNINYKNINSRWFKILFNSREWLAVLKAQSFLAEIEDFKKEIVVIPS